MSSLEAHRSPQHHHGYSGRSCAQQRARCSLRNDIHGRLTSKKKRAATSQGAIARALRLASESVERAHQNGARTLRNASANVEQAHQNGARTLRNASANIKKSRPSGARTLRIASASVEKSRTSCARTLRIASANSENLARAVPDRCKSHL